MEGSQPAAMMGDVPTETRPAVPGSPVRPPRLRSPLLRAVVPVLGGAVVIGLIFVSTWLVALFIANGGADSTSRLAPPTFSAGSAERRAESVAEDGPLIFPGLNTTSGERTLVVDHEGDDPLSGWKLYWAYPADRDAGLRRRAGARHPRLHRLRRPRRGRDRPGPAGGRLRPHRRRDTW